MKNLFLLAVALLWLLTVSTKSIAQTKSGKIQAGYFATFGRYATEAEVSYWMSQPEQPTVAQYANLNKQWLKGQPGGSEPTAVIQRAYSNVMGRQPTAAEINYWLTTKPMYAELFANNISWMNSNVNNDNGGKAAMIKKSYQTVFSRLPSQAELNYWIGQPTVPYTTLLALHQSWRLANAGSSTQATGNSIKCGVVLGNVSVVGVDPPLANQIRDVPGGSSLIAAPGVNLIGQDGGGLVASGGGNLVASGGGNLVASGGGNLVSKID